MTRAVLLRCASFEAGHALTIVCCQTFLRFDRAVISNAETSYYCDNQSIVICRNERVTRWNESANSALCCGAIFDIAAALLSGGKIPKDSPQRLQKSACSSQISRAARRRDIVTFNLLTNPHYTGVLGRFFSRAQSTLAEYIQRLVYELAKISETLGRVSKQELLNELSGKETQVANEKNIFQRRRK